MLIEREQNDECTRYGSNLELAHSLSIKIKHLKRVFQMKINCV
jgi:hypothetical protein